MSRSTQKHNEYMKKWRIDNKDKCNSYIAVSKAKKPELYEKIAKKKNSTDSNGHVSKNGRYTNAKFIAKKRDIEFILTIDEYWKIINNTCYYCQNILYPPTKRGMGLDRLDNSIGYTYTNVVSCCKLCNMIKNDQLTTEETLVAVRAILKLRAQ